MKIVQGILVLLLYVHPVVSSAAGFKGESKLKPDEPRGYVEFYYDAQSTLGGVAIFSGTWQELDQMSVFKRSRRRIALLGFYRTQYRLKLTKTLKVADKPGFHSYALRYGTFKKTIDVEIMEGMVLPIELEIRETQPPDWDTGYKRIHFSFHVRRHSFSDRFLQPNITVAEHEGKKKGSTRSTANPKSVMTVPSGARSDTPSESVRDATRVDASTPVDNARKASPSSTDARNTQDDRTEELRRELEELMKQAMP